MKKDRPDTRHQERPRIRLHNGDTVEVISGRDRGSRGDIQEILRDEKRVRVAGLRLVTKHQRGGRAMQQQAGRIQMPGKIPVSSVQLVCPTCNRRTRPRFEGDSAASKQRFCRHSDCGAPIPRPTATEE